MTVDITPGMRWAAGEAKSDGCTKIEFKNTVRKSIMKMCIDTTPKQKYVSAKIKAAEEAIDEIWDSL